MISSFAQILRSADEINLYLNHFHIRDIITLLFSVGRSVSFLCDKNELHDAWDDDDEVELVEGGHHVAL